MFTGMQITLKNKKMSRLAQKLYLPVDNSPLVVFRIIFGLLLFYHCVAFIYKGDVYLNFIQPPFTFSYIGFEFLQPLPGNGMYFYFGLMALLALLIMLGAWYRLAMFGFTFLWAVVYLMQKSNYNNHYYLMLLLCLLMCFMPANRYCSVDVKRKPAIKANTCYRYIPFLMVAQMGIIYFYAAISKLNADWLSGKFIALQFARLTTRRLVGPVYANEYFQLLIVYGGFLFDLSVIPLLLYKKTRTYAFILFCGFHLFNAYSFNIGIFPWLSIAMGIFFFTPDKIRQRFFKRKPVSVINEMNHFLFTPGKKAIACIIGFYLLLQIILPLRPAFYTGNVFWTEEGYRMSWKMMLRTKSGEIYFKVADPQSGKIWYDHPLEKSDPSHVRCMAIAPDIIWQYAQRLKKEYAGKGYPMAQVFAIDSVSLNNNPRQLFIDTTVNLASVKWQHFSHSTWIMPYKEP
jgi:vitamin K-dependent gamma-carboxylase